MPLGESDKKDGKMCEYCSYRSVCAREGGQPFNKISKLTHLKALERLDGEEIE
jgi:ATP-dependent helicase/DNAse subunit B